MKYLQQIMNQLLGLPPVLARSINIQEPLVKDWSALQVPAYVRKARRN
jgi:hypothetical protein